MFDEKREVKIFFENISNGFEFKNVVNTNDVENRLTFSLSAAHFSL